MGTIIGLWERLRRQKALTLGIDRLPPGNSTAIEMSWLLKGRGDVAGLSLSLASPASHHVRDTFSAIAPSCTFTHFTFPKLSKVKDCCRSFVSMGFRSADSINGGSKTVRVHGYEGQTICLVL